MSTVTIKNIAKEAGVSVTTVSLILNKKDVNFAKETVDKVWQVVKEKNYMPNQIAACMKTKRSKTIGVIIPDIQSPFFSEAVKYIEREVKKRNYNMLLCCSYWNVEEDLKYIRLLRTKGIDGLIIALAGDSERNGILVDTLNDCGMPFISLDRWVEGLQCARVSIDHNMGGYIATKYLIEKGHTKIGCITGAMSSYTARRREKGYRQAMLEAGLPIKEEWIYEGDYQFQGGYDGGKALLKTDVTAIFASNDVMAYGLYRAAEEECKRIPDDISIIGFDDLQFSSMLAVPLTSVRQSVEELAIKATECLFKEIFDEHVERIDVKLDVSIMERRSVKQL